MLDIIIVEDNKEIGTLLSDFLRKEHYVVSIAENGEKALELFERYARYRAPRPPERKICRISF